MRIVTFIFIAIVGIHPVIAEEPAIENLVKRIEALEKKVATLSAQVAISRHEEQKREAPDSGASGEIVAKVSRDGRIRVEGKLMDDDAFSRVLESAVALSPDHSVIIRGDRETKYKNIVRVLNLCQKAGIWNISFATAKPDAEEGAAPLAPDVRREP